MNSLVPNWETLDDWVVSINSMFGAILNLNVSYFDADVEKKPPFVTDIPGRTSSGCFTFQEITTNSCTSEIYCKINLIEKIEAYIGHALAPPKDTSKATIVWRIPPEIKQDTSDPCPSAKYGEITKGLWFGYARLKVLDRNSKEGSYQLCQ